MKQDGGGGGGEEGEGGQTCKKSRPPGEGNFQDLGKFKNILNNPVGEICHSQLGKILISPWGHLISPKKGEKGRVTFF